jgi:hypothetical protein
VFIALERDDAEDGSGRPVRDFELEIDCMRTNEEFVDVEEVVGTLVRRHRFVEAAVRAVQIAQRGPEVLERKP